MSFDLFMNDVVKNAREDMVNAGYAELTTAEEVEAAFAQEGTTLVMVNSVCGCAGGTARPAAANSINYDKRPDQLTTVFAGQDREATEKAREYFTGYTPSSPSFALLKDGQICKMIERSEIEGSTMQEVVQKLQGLFDAYCEEV